MPGTHGKSVFSKLESVLQKNPGYNTLKEISAVLEGKSCNIPANVKLKNVTLYKYVPITSCDVERSFSCYKTILIDRRHNHFARKFGKITSNIL